MTLKNHYFVYFFYFFLSQHLLYQVIMTEFKMSYIEHSQKKYKDFSNQLNAAQTADQHVVLVTQRKIQKTSE